MQTTDKFRFPFFRYLSVILLVGFSAPSFGDLTGVVNVSSGAKYVCTWSNINPGDIQGGDMQGPAPVPQGAGSTNMGASWLAMMCSLSIIEPGTVTTKPQGPLNHPPYLLCNMTFDSPNGGAPTTVTWGPYPEDQCTVQNICKNCKVVQPVKNF